MKRTHLLNRHISRLVAELGHMDEIIVADAGLPTGVAYVGSVNPFLDESVQTERELGILITDPASIDRIDSVFTRDFDAGSSAS